MSELQVVATIPAKPEAADAIREALKTLVAATRAEEGCLSYELFARKVFPHFKGTTGATRGSRDWVAEQRPQQLGRAGEAIMKAIGDHAAEGSASGNALKEAIEHVL